MDLRVQAVPQNAVLEDQGRMAKIRRELVKTLRTEHRTESVIADLGKTFSEESKQTIQKIGKDRIF